MMEIRKATKKDTLRLVNIVNGVKSLEDFPGEYSQSMFNKKIGERDNLFLVIEIDKIIVGFIICEINKEGKRIYIDSLAVDKNYRNKGIAGKLIKFVEKYSRKEKLKTIYFNTRIWNKSMNKLAEGNKYKIKDKFFIWEKNLK